MISILINSIEKSGAEIQLYFFCQVLKSKNIDFEIIYFSKTSNQIKFEKTIYCNSKSHFSRIIFLYKYLKKNNRQFLISFLNRSTYYLSLISLLLKPSKSIAFFRSYEKKNNFLDHLKNYLALKNFSSIYSNSIENRDFMSKKYCLERSSNFFIPNFIDVSLRKKVIYNEYIYCNEQINILVLARNTPQKNLDLIFRIFELLPKYYYLQIAGKGFSESYIENVKSKKHGCRISFFGFVNKPHDLLFQTDILLSTSLYEGMSNSIIEALLLGIPIVSSKIGVDYFISQNFKGLNLIDNWNEKAYAKKIISLGKRNSCFLNNFENNNKEFNKIVEQIIK